MKYLLLALGICLTSFVVAQTTPPAKLILKNRDTITGKILEIVPETSVKVLIYGTSEVTIPYSQIDYILFDGQETLPAESKRTSKPLTSEESTQKDFYFMSVNEGVVGLGVGNIGGFMRPYFNQFGQQAYANVPNATSYVGFYSANGIGYKGWGFAGIGVAALGYSDDYGFEVPFLLDLRARVLPTKKISPIIMTNVGLGYHRGSVGSFDFNDGIGVSLKFSNRFEAHALACHSYVKYDAQLSASGAAGSIGNYYFNYIGLRIGTSFSF